MASLLHGIERRAFRLEAPELAFLLGIIRDWRGGPLAAGRRHLLPHRRLKIS